MDLKGEMVVISRLYRSIFFILCSVPGLMAGDAVDAYRSARSDVERLLALGKLQPEVIHGSVRRKLGDRFGKGAVSMRKNIQREMDALAKRIRSQQFSYNSNMELLRQRAQSIKKLLVTERTGCQEAKNAMSKTAQESAHLKERLEQIVQDRAVVQKRAEVLDTAIKRHEQEAVTQKEIHEKETTDAAAKAQEQHRLDTVQAAKAAQERDIAQRRAEELETAVKRHEQEAVAQKEIHEKEITDAAARAQEQHRLDTAQAAKAAQERDIAQKRAEELETAVKRHEQEAVTQKEIHEKEITDAAARAQEQHRLDTVQAAKAAQERDIAQKRAEELEIAVKRHEQEIDKVTAEMRTKDQRLADADKVLADQRQAAAKIESDRAKLEAAVTAKNKEMSNLRQSAMRARIEEMFVKPGLIQQKLAAVQRPSNITDKVRIGQLSSVVRAQKSAIEGLNQKITDLTRPTVHAELPGPAVFPAQARPAQKAPEAGVTQRVINKLSTMFEWFNPREARERLAAESTDVPVAPVRGPIELSIGEPTTAFQESFEPIVSSPAGAAEPKMVISSSQPEADIAGLMFKQLAQEDPSAVTKLTGMLAEKVTAPESPMISASTAARTAELARGLASAASVATGYLPG